MALIRKITLTKTESTPEDAFSKYPHPSAEQLAEFSAAYSVTRKVEETADSLIITLTFPTIDSVSDVSRDSLQQQLKQTRFAWVEENHISESTVQTVE